MDKVENKLIITVVNSGFADEVVDIAREKGATGATIFNARGTGMQNKSFLGIKVEPEKAVVMIVVPVDIVEPIMNTIYEKLGVATPASGVCISLPVDAMTKLRTE